jgi:hypothetical protein
MKTELRAVPHATIKDRTVIEVWFGNEFVATIYPGDGPSIRVISKHWLQASPARSECNLSLNEIVVCLERK